MEPVLVTASVPDLFWGSKAVIDDGKGNNVRMVKRKDGSLFLAFHSSRGTAKSFFLTEGKQYLVWPTYAKPHVPVETDTYWPRRWVNEVGSQISHKKYFVFVDACGGQPQTVEHRSHHCFVNREWFRTATYDEFCWEMDLSDRESYYWYELQQMIEDYLEYHLVEAFANGSKQIHVCMSDVNRSFEVFAKLTRYSTLSAIITDQDRNIPAHGPQQVYNKLSEVVWEHTHHALRQFHVDELLKKLRMSHFTGHLTIPGSR